MVTSTLKKIEYLYTKYIEPYHLEKLPEYTPASQIIIIFNYLLVATQEVKEKIQFTYISAFEDDGGFSL